MTLIITLRYRDMRMTEFEYCNQPFSTRKKETIHKKLTIAPTEKEHFTLKELYKCVNTNV